MTAPTSAHGVDFEEVLRRTDLRALIADDIGPPRRGKRWPCPFHNGEHANLGMDRRGRCWKCFTCGLAGTALDWLMRRDGITVLKAARRLGGLEPSTPRRRKGQVQSPAPAERRETPASWHPAWQAAVGRLVAEAAEMLWSADGLAALDWLRERGLHDDTIRRYRLGFIPVDGWSPSFVWPDGIPGGIFRPRGITIPWVAPGAWYSPQEIPDGPRWVGCNVRRLAQDPSATLPDPPKCLAFKGSSRGYLYPWADVLPTEGAVPALLCEGEFDALLAMQEASHVVHAGTVGGAGQTPHRTALAALACCPWWLLALDHDEAGVEEARAWKHRAQHKARRLMLPSGKDLSDFHRAGGDVLDWLKGEWERFGWPWPGRGTHP
jgi:hypothetical protein